MLNPRVWGFLGLDTGRSLHPIVYSIEELRIPSMTVLFSFGTGKCPGLKESDKQEAPPERKEDFRNHSHGSREPLVCIGPGRASAAAVCAQRCPWDWETT